MKLPEGSEYVALGSSYGAGPGLGDRVPDSPRRAGRSTHNYAHVVADRLKLRLTDVTYSGATVAQILGTERGPTAIPQLDAVTSDTRLVTLTGGGNDVGYIGYLVMASLPALIRTVIGGNRRMTELSNDTEFERKGSLLGSNLIALVDAIRARSPETTIVMTDYLALLPPENAVGGDPLRREDVDRGRRYWTHLGLILRQAAGRAGVLFADVSTESSAHHAWSADPWTERFVLLGGKAAAYHPNRAGMAAAAVAVEAAVASAP